MTLMRALVDRCYREFLHPGDDQPNRSPLTDALTADDTDTAVTFNTALFEADYDDAWAPGTIIEVGREQMLVVAGTSMPLTVTRGVNGTDVEAHGVGDLVTVQPKHTRQAVFDACADAVVNLWPRLWHVETVDATVTQPFTEIPADAVTVVQWRTAYGGTRYSSSPTTIVRDFAASATGVALFIDDDTGTQGWLTYRGRFARPTAETTDVADLGVDEAWDQIIVVGAAAYLLSGTPDIDAATANFITEALAAEAFPALTAGRISDRLFRLHELLLERASRSLRATDRGRIRRLPPARSRVL